MVSHLVGFELAGGDMDISLVVVVSQIHRLYKPFQVEVSHIRF
jgi:hypothetical protein